MGRQPLLPGNNAKTCSLFPKRLWANSPLRSSRAVPRHLGAAILFSKVPGTLHAVKMQRQSPENHSLPGHENRSVKNPRMSVPARSRR